MLIRYRDRTLYRRKPRRSSAYSAVVADFLPPAHKHRHKKEAIKRVKARKLIVPVFSEFLPPRKPKHKQAVEIRRLKSRKAFNSTITPVFSEFTSPVKPRRFPPAARRRRKAAHLVIPAINTPPPCGIKLQIRYRNRVIYHHKPVRLATLAHTVSNDIRPFLEVFT